jgi:flagellar hook assembly protein FlgD
VADGIYTSGDADFNWNTLDDAGNPVPSGMYLARIETLTGSMAVPLHIFR